MANNNETIADRFKALSPVKKGLFITGGVLVIVLLVAGILGGGSSEPDNGDVADESGPDSDGMLVSDGETEDEDAAVDNTQPLTEEEQALEDEQAAGNEEEYKEIKDGEIVNPGDGASEAEESTEEEETEVVPGADSDASEDEVDLTETESEEPDDPIVKGGNLSEKDYSKMDAPADAAYSHPSSDYTEDDLAAMIEVFYGATLYPMTQDNKDTIMRDMKAIMTSSLYDSYFPGGNPENVESGEREVNHEMTSMVLAEDSSIGDDFVEFKVKYNFKSIPGEDSDGQLVYTDHAESVTFALIDGEYRITGITA